MSVYAKLNEAREKFHAIKLEKTGHNKFAGYKYFELGDFLIPALKVFRESGLCAVVSFGEDIACMTIRDVEKPDDCLTITSPMGSAALKGCHEVQNIGAVETYQRRYLWVAALEIVEHDALDSSEPVKASANDANPGLVHLLEASIEDAKAKKRAAPRTIAMKARAAIQEHLVAGRELGALQEWQSLHDIEDGVEIAGIVWNGLTTPERDEIRRLNSAAQTKGQPA